MAAACGLRAPGQLSSRRHCSSSLLPAVPRAELQGAPQRVAASPEIPKQTALLQNEPNPFNPATRIRFDLATASLVDLRIYDMAGRVVKQLVGGSMPAGSHSVEWNGRDSAGQPVASGIWFYRLETSGFSSTRRMLLLN